MRNAEEFPGPSPDRTRALPTYRRLAARAGRARYVHDETVPRETVLPAEPHCTLHQGTTGYQGTAGFQGASGYQGASGHRGGAEAGRNDGELGIAWSAQFPVAARRNDTWVLVCGGIATAAAFVAAFVASGGVVSHAATTGSTVPAAVSRACPSSAAGPTP